ncbi:MAG: DsbA family oxidoreductase [Acidimicrobiales bacterium]
MVKVEIWSDVVCPWCYIGKRRFEAALSHFTDREAVEVTWRSFELDPNAPTVRHGDPLEGLARKYGMSLGQAQATYQHITEVAAGEGLDFQLHTTRSGNTMDAHRLLHLAKASGHQDALKERLLAAYLTEGRTIGDPATLVELADAVGIDSDQARDTLAGDTYRSDVRADEAEAEELGISGVPFFVFDRRYMVSGAQPTQTFVAALTKAGAQPSPNLISVGEGSGLCGPKGCAI